MSELFLHNSLTRRKERFTPLDPLHVRMYVCGPTVYDRPHIGNARPAVVFDVLARLLRRLYPSLTYVRNVTDVDDKINARAAENHEPIAALTARTLELYHRDMAALGVAPPDIEPRATMHIAEMITLIERLIEGGHAYEAAGHVLFAVASFPDYGRLSGRSPEELRAGARVEVAPYKRDPGDFVLWKPSPPDLPGWESPWGCGRPGWHIECSAMSWRYLGADFDIHGGGGDLLFPHHENEIAQSCCAFPGSHFARVWLHNGMLLVSGEKMSKSLGNIITVEELLARAPGEAVRFALLRTHYRGVLDFSDAALMEAKRELDRFYRALQKTAPLAEGDVPERVMAALCDDLNTPRAIAEMHKLADAALAGDQAAATGLRKAGDLLGILQTDPNEWFKIATSNVGAIGPVHMHAESRMGFSWRGIISDEGVELRIAERAQARREKNFARADEIRQDLAALGIILEDGPAGTTWRRG
ncbi:cysteine--tRNA ligase [Acidibrevibacterium fodinaquatile]|uniref:cysteine--tRNA ligase n=1 Tax=Acidibrevibacterium fodinaquatile TaxID=1969806 RepID=UPI000E0D9623|nr:cysteine--tRNA ligase [Acidibrevibacterium fodinaquatile]